VSNIILKGNTSGQVTIAAPDVGNNNTLTLPTTDSTLATENALGVRNLIINGDMQIAQRGTSASVSGTGFTYDTVDRWKYSRVATQLVTSLSQSTDVPTGQGFSNSWKLDVTTAETAIDSADYARLQYIIEGQMLQHLKYGTASAESITLSFWVKSSKTGNYNITLYRDESTDRMNVNNVVTISSANTWEKKTITLDGDTSASITNDNGSRLVILLWLNAGSNYTSSSTSGWQNFSVSTYASGHTATWGTSTSDDFYITGVQLEVGDTATPFEHRPYDMELARCMRYFWKTFPTSVAPAQNTATGNMLFAGIRADVLAGHDFTVEMRAAPTLISYNPYASNSSFRAYGGADHTVTNIVADTKRIMWINLGSPFTPPNGVHGHITASAEL
jgi:hypothetical protein